MPQFMDIHNGIRDMEWAEMVQLHERDLTIQNKHDVRFTRCWYDAGSGRVFCLSEAPNVEAHLAAHKEAHGAMPDEIFEVLDIE
jgi:Protein of unknown function (DUF4242)